MVVEGEEVMEGVVGMGFAVNEAEKGIEQKKGTEVEGVVLERKADGGEGE